MKHAWSSSISLPRIVSAGCLLVTLGCHMNNNDDIAAISYVCGHVPAADPNATGSDRCGANDPLLPPEPYVADGRGWPPTVTDPACTLKATRVTPPEGQVLDEPLNYVESATVLDTARIRAALAVCPIVRLTTDGENNAFLSGHIDITGTTLWIDKGVTLFMSRNADL